MGGGAVAACGADDDAFGAVDELGVGGLDVDHEVAEDGSGADHDAGGEHVEDELGGGAGFETGAAGKDFGPGEGGDGDVGDGSHGGAGGAGEGDREGAEVACVPEGSEDVGGSAAGGDADEGVWIVICGPVAEAGGCEVVRADFGGVFGAFAGAAERGVAAGDDGVEEAGWDGEGGGALAGVEDGKAAAGSGADEEKTAAATEAVGDGVHGCGDLWKLGADGGGDGRVFVVDDLEHVESGELVDVRGSGVRGLGSKGGEVGLGSGVRHRASG